MENKKIIFLAILLSTITILQENTFAEIRTDPDSVNFDIYNRTLVTNTTIVYDIPRLYASLVEKYDNDIVKVQKDMLNETSPGVWVMKNYLSLPRDEIFYINSSTVNELRLTHGYNGWYMLGKINIDNTRIAGWDESNNNYCGFNLDCTKIFVTYGNITNTEFRQIQRIYWGYELESRPIDGLILHNTTLRECVEGITIYGTNLDIDNIRIIDAHPGLGKGSYESKINDSVIRNVDMINLSDTNIDSHSFGLYMIYAYNLTLENISIINAHEGITIKEGNRLLIDNITIRDGYRFGGTGFRSCNFDNSVLRNLRIINTSTQMRYGQTGAYGYQIGGDNNTHENIYVNGTGYSGFNLGGNNNTFNNIIVANTSHNAFEAQSTNSIYTNINIINFDLDALLSAVGPEDNADGIPSGNGNYFENISIDKSGTGYSLKLSYCSNYIIKNAYVKSAGLAIYNSTNITVINLTQTDNPKGTTISYADTTNLGSRDIKIIDSSFLGKFNVMYSYNVKLINTIYLDKYPYLLYANYTTAKYADILVKDNRNTSIDELQLIISGKDSGYDSYGNEASIFTTRNAHTYLPSVQRHNSPAIPDYTEIYGYTIQNHTSNISAYDQHNIWTNITQTVYPNNTIRQPFPLAHVTGIHPNETWYRPDPSTPTVTIELEIPENYTRTNISIETETEINITVNTWQPESTGIKVNLTAESTDSNNVNITICNLSAPANYLIKKDTINFDMKTANIEGCITFNNSIWTEHQFTIEETQEGTYNISGYITETNSTIIPGALISTGYSGTENTTNADGHFIIHNIPNGTYNITASKPGYLENSTMITITSENIENINMTLSTDPRYINPANITINLPNHLSTLPYTTTSVTLNISTDENAICRYNTSTPDFNYTESVNMTVTGYHNHLMNISVSAGNTYTYYYKCNDSQGNINTNAATHTFSIAQIPTNTPSGSGSSSSSSSSSSIPIPTTTVNETNQTDEDNQITGHTIDINTTTDDNNNTATNQTQENPNTPTDNPPTTQPIEENPSNTTKYIAITIVIILASAIIIAKTRKNTPTDPRPLASPNTSTITELEIQKRKLEEINQYISQIRPIIVKMTIENQISPEFEKRLDELETETKTAEEYIKSNPDQFEEKLRTIIGSLNILKQEIEEKTKISD